MLSMPSSWVTDFDARRHGMRLLRALVCCLALALDARSQPAPPPDAPPGSTSAAPIGVPAPSSETASTAAPTEEQPPALEREDDPKKAVSEAQELVKSTERQFGKNSRQSAEANSDLAQAQRQAGDHEGAAKSYLAAIDAYRGYDGPFSPLVIPVLTALGDSYKESNDFLNAVSAYGEARTINRRTYGLLNEDQIPLLERTADAMRDLNQPAQADEQQLEALRIVERNHPPESDEALAGIYKYAAWLRDTSRYAEERDQYNRALRVIRDNYGKDDVRQARPLLGIGNSFRVQRIPEGTGAGALRDALSLLLAQSDPDERMVAQALRDIGDWEVAFTKVDYDGAEYRRAWQLLGSVPDGDQLRQEWFTGPNYVLREPISLRGISQEPKAPSGHVLVRFDLDSSGRSLNETIVESDPPGLKDEAVLRHVRRSRFRPQMMDGEIVPRKGLALQFTYRYTADALADEAKSHKD
jgi:tetratricopeptide (TPR) repeat protein